MMFLGLAMYFFATSMALWKTLKATNGRKSDMFVAVLYGLVGNDYIITFFGFLFNRAA